MPMRKRSSIAPALAVSVVAAARRTLDEPRLLAVVAEVAFAPVFPQPRPIAAMRCEMGGGVENSLDWDGKLKYCASRCWGGGRRDYWVGTYVVQSYLPT